MLSSPRLLIETTPERDLARRWLITFFATAVGACVGIGLLNFVVNPHGNYPTRYFPPLTWSSREAKLALLRAERAPPKVLVLGSSRSMKVPPSEIERLTSKNAFNASVDSARVEDWLALYSYAREGLGIRVEEIVLGIDIEAFHDHLEPDARLLATPELRPYVPLAMRWPWYANTAQSLLSYAQAVDSVRSLRFYRSGYPPAPHAFDADGFLHYPAWEREIAAGTFRPRLEPPFLDYQGRFAGFTALDGPRKALFEQMLGDAQRDGVRVRGFLTPLHSALVGELRSTRDFDRLRALAVAYLAAMPAKFPIFSFVDFTDVAAFGGDPAGFLDAAHTDDENSRRMTAALWEHDALQ